MKLGLIVNELRTEQAGYTTTRLAIAAINRGHEVWVMAVGDLAYDPDERVRALAHRAPKSQYKSSEKYLTDLRESDSERVTLDDLDVLMLRNDPSADAITRPWAMSAGIIFGRAAIGQGVVVLNDANGLAKATNKMYFQLFPEEVRPRTLITRDAERIKRFFKEQGGNVVLKPLQGSGGQSVFLARRDDQANLNQMIEAVSRDGFVIAQEYLPAAVEGDTRLFLMNGVPLKYKGKYAAFRRKRTGGDMRSNVHAGGTLAQAEIDDNALRIAEIVRPKLVEDGMFLVGLDIVGDKLMEINVFSPGGLGSAQKFEGVDFNQAVIDALERKSDYVRYYRRKFDNVAMATL